MSQHARIEELSDSSSNSDPSEADPSDFVIRPATPPISKPTANNPPQPPSQQSLQPQPLGASTAAPPEYKHYQCLYPLYFDAQRTRSEGRRVGADSAVPNPLAREIADAVQMLGLKTVFEPGKTHPRDWSNPGRVRVLLREGGKAQSSQVKNKHHLYSLVCLHLKLHPTTKDSPLRLPIQGMPMPDGPIPPPAVPRGWKINGVLPLHSPALSGGGVSDNILKDMMQEMQGMSGENGAPGGMVEGAGAGPGKRKREGKKK